MMQMSRLDFLIKLYVRIRTEREAEEQIADLFDAETDTIPPHVRAWMAQQQIPELGAPAPQAPAPQAPAPQPAPGYQPSRPQLSRQPQQPQANGQLPATPPHRKPRRNALAPPPQSYPDQNGGGQQ